jgi:branched-chain amino acid transport system substrate-binding protein
MIRRNYRKGSSMARGALLTLVLLALAACSQGTTTGSSGGSGVVKFGLEYNVTGALSVADGPNSLAVKLAIDQVNKKGFVVGGKTYHIEYSEVDLRTDATAAVAGATSLVQDQGLKFIFGPAGAATPVVPITTKAKVMWFSAGNTLAALLEASGPTGNLQYDFHNLTLEDKRDLIIANSVKDYLPSVKKVALLLRNDPAGQQISKNLKAGLVAAGYTVTSSDLYAPGTIDFSPILTRAKGSSPDLLMLGYIPIEAQAIVKQAVSLGVAPALYGVSISLEVALKDAIGGPVNVPFVDSYPGPIAWVDTSGLHFGDQGIADFSALWQQKYGQPMPTGPHQSPTEFSNVFMLVQAMEAAGSVDDIDAISAKLASVVYQSPYFGTLKYDSHHHLVGPTGVCSLISGKVSCKTYLPSA